MRRVVMGLDAQRKTPCGFCFVVYDRREVCVPTVCFFVARLIALLEGRTTTTLSPPPHDPPKQQQDALAAVRYLNGTSLDERPIRVDVDYGFEEGRQFGRGRSGGQVRDEFRTDYDSARGGFGKQLVQQIHAQGLTVRETEAGQVAFVPLQAAAAGAYGGAGAAAARQHEDDGGDGGGGARGRERHEEEEEGGDDGEQRRGGGGDYAAEDDGGGGSPRRGYGGGDDDDDHGGSGGLEHRSKRRRLGSDDDGDD